MRKAVQQYITNYNICQKLKHLRHKSYKEIKKLKTLKEAQKSIAADFIIKLPLFKNSTTKIIYNSVLIIIDRFTKYTSFIFYLKIATAKDFTYIFIRNIFANHRMPKKIMSN